MGSNRCGGERWSLCNLARTRKETELMAKRASEEYSIYSTMRAFVEWEVRRQARWRFCLGMIGSIIGAIVFITLADWAHGQDVYDGCGPNGTATRSSELALNTLKNRYFAPTHIDATIQLVTFYNDSSQKWDVTQAAIIEGLVDEVKEGGIESCNCKAKDAPHRDTHICLVLYPKDYGNKRRHVIVEVTPRLRAAMAAKGVDWSTAALKKLLTKHLVRFTGWIFYDKEHEPEAENINPGGKINWRFTCAEIHPVTAIEVLK